LRKKGINYWAILKPTWGDRCNAEKKKGVRESEWKHGFFSPK